MDPHYSSGIPNFAFYNTCMALGGKSWEKAGRIWYHAIARYPASPNMKMKTFANRTRNAAKVLFTADLSVFAAVDAAWKGVGL